MNLSSLEYTAILNVFYAWLNFLFPRDLERQVVFVLSDHSLDSSEYIGSFLISFRLYPMWKINFFSKARD